MVYYKVFTYIFKKLHSLKNIIIYKRDTLQILNITMQLC